MSTYFTVGTLKTDVTNGETSDETNTDNIVDAVDDGFDNVETAVTALSALVASDKTTTATLPLTATLGGSNYALKLINDGDTDIDEKVSTDGTLAGNDDTVIVTEKAIKTYADTMLPLAGGVMSGTLDMDGTGVGAGLIIDVVDPSNPQDAATKNYVDTTSLPLAGGTMTGDIDMDSNTITGLPTPSASTDAVNKAYADNAAQVANPTGVHYKGDIQGWTFNNSAGDPAHDVTIAPGTGKDETGALQIMTSSAFTKRLDSHFEAGSSTGGLLNGVAAPMAASQLYHIYMLADSTATQPTDVAFLLAGDSITGRVATFAPQYDSWRWIGFVTTSAANQIQQFRLEGDVVTYDTGVISTNGSFTRTSYGVFNSLHDWPSSYSKKVRVAGVSVGGTALHWTYEAAEDDVTSATTAGAIVWSTHGAWIIPETVLQLNRTTNSSPCNVWIKSIELWR